MESFHWDHFYITGISDVDEQHKHLVDVINEFGNLLTENKVVFKDIDEIIKKLADYTHYHFQAEETLMKDKGVDPRHVNEHIRIHHEFIQEVVKFHEGLSENNLDSANKVLNFLTNWLAYHILGTDQNMARQLESISLGTDPAEAYEQDEKERDETTEPLLRAVNNLFEQVTDKNRELLELNQSLEEKVKQRTQELSKANRSLEALSLTDVLTDLPNRRHAMKNLAYLWDESTTNHSSLACIMIDADHFKEVNDTYGHDAGDVVLKQLARSLLESFRNDDIVCRLGGDEFFVICPDTDQKGVMYISEVARQKISKLRVNTGGEPWHGSISVGAAARTTDMTSFEELIKAADEGVYIAKKAGKNCVRSIF